MKRFRLTSMILAFVMLFGNCPLITLAASDDLPESYIETIQIQTSAEDIILLSLEDGVVEMTNTNEELWIDRIADLPEQLRSFYNTLVEGTDNDGSSDILIDESYYSEGNSITAITINIPENEVTNLTETVNDYVARYSPYVYATLCAFDRDHPEVFWTNSEWKLSIATGYDDSESEYVIKIAMLLKYGTYDFRAEGYQSTSAIKNAIVQRDGAVNAILNAASDENTYGKIKYFNEWLTKANQYNTSADLNNIAHECLKCISALTGKTGTEGPVCEGYARAFKVLCDKEGIPCVLVDGFATSSAGTGAHMWNYVQLEGAWYAVDVTWNDPVVAGVNGAESTYESESWLLVGSDTEVSGSKFITSHPVSNSPVAGLSLTNGPVLNTTAYVAPTSPYYSSWDEAEKAVMSACDISYTYHYTDAQADLIHPFLNKWVAKALETTSQSEAEAVLKEAKADFDSMNIHDAAAMEAHAAFMKVRDALIKEKAAIRDEKCDDVKYTSESRKEYAVAIADIVSAMSTSRNSAELENWAKEFDKLTGRMLVELPTDVIAAKEAAKAELEDTLKNDYESTTTIDSFYTKIDNCDSEEEIKDVVQECKDYLKSYVNKNITIYRSAKRNKVSGYMDSFETELGDKFSELTSFVSDNCSALNNATTKETVDVAYNALIAGIDAKVAELENESSNVAVTGIALNITAFTLEIGDSVQLTATITPENATDKEVSWTSSDESIVTVDARGNVKAMKTGEATITVKCGGVLAKCEVTVENSEKDECSAGHIAENCPSTHFTDLDLNFWYHLNVDYVVSNGLMLGTGSTTFGADMNTNRSMIVAILYRMSGENVTQEALENCKFRDVPKDAYYTNAVAWAASKGIVAGVSDTEFAPDKEITREQMVAMLRRYANYLGCNTNERGDLSGFADADLVSSWALEDVRWASAVGMISGGMENGVVNLKPQGQTPRIQAAAFIHRFCEKYNK